MVACGCGLLCLILFAYISGFYLLLLDLRMCFLGFGLISGFVLIVFWYSFCLRFVCGFWLYFGCGLV